MLDGHQRARIADELGVAYETTTIAVEDEEDARRLARQLNEARRANPAKERLPMEVKLREQGHSLRAIAGAVGVDETTVRRDLSGATYAAPPTTTGRDGKRYPARKPSAVRATEITRLVNEGHTPPQIAAAIGIGVEQVKSIAKRHRIGLPDAGLGSHVGAKPERARMALAAVIASGDDPVIVSMDGWPLHASTWLRERMGQTRGARP